MFSVMYRSGLSSQERYESVVQKTMERSQKVKQRSTLRRASNTKNNTTGKMNVTD